MGNRELDFVNKARVRKYSAIKMAMNDKTFRKYMSEVTKEVESNISDILPQKFGLMFDG